MHVFPLRLVTTLSGGQLGSVASTLATGRSIVTEEQSSPGCTEQGRPSGSTCHFPSELLRGTTEGLDHDVVREEAVKWAEQERGCCVSALRRCMRLDLVFSFLGIMQSSRPEAGNV